ncbi:hypothetical protein RZS08_63385, partial [Arthrospira platensis SPKY1]|nr:hypothetical protein [Arthrospira platensis SPKY1]
MRQIVDQLEEFAQNPYTSTRAVGDFIVVAKSDKFLQYEGVVRDEQLSAAARRTAQTEMDKMRTQPNHFRVFSADSQAEAEQILRQQRANFGTGQAGVQMHVLSGSKG